MMELYNRVFGPTIFFLFDDRLKRKERIETVILKISPINMIYQHLKDIHKVYYRINVEE